MTLDELKATLQASAPPPELSPAIAALWHDARGEWEAAHRIAQDVAGKDGSWVHAYLHRKEGDAGNAAYWYRRAGQPAADDSLTAEWERIAVSLLTGP